MGFSRRWFRWKSVHHDEGYDISFVGMQGRARKLRYSDGSKLLTIAAEPVKLGGEKGWGLHFSLGDQYLTKWDDGSPMSGDDREAVRQRIPAALEYMHVVHRIDLK